MTDYPILISSDQRPVPECHTYQTDADVGVGDVITVSGMRALVEEIHPAGNEPPVLECRRLWKLRLVDRCGALAGPGFIINEQRHHTAQDTLVLEGGERFCVREVQDSWPPGFDGSFVVDHLAETARSAGVSERPAANPTASEPPA